MVWEVSRHDLYKISCDLQSELSHNFILLTHNELSLTVTVSLDGYKKVCQKKMFHMLKHGYKVVIVR